MLYYVSTELFSVSSNAWLVEDNICELGLGQTNTPACTLYSLVMNIFQYLLTFYEKNICALIDSENEFSYLASNYP